jgi:hypothetical protein
VSDEKGQFPRVVLARGGGLRFVDAEQALNRFEALLAERRIKVGVGSRLEQIFLSLTEYLALHRREMHLPPTVDRRDQWLRMLGLVDLALKLLAASETALFPRLVPHLKLFASLTADPSQNARTDPNDDNNHKLFELLTGAACVRFCDDLFMEGPKSNATFTPDLTVISDVKRWGVACKVLHSDKPTTYRDRVSEAIGQIDRAALDRGVVLINVKALLPVDELLPFGRKSVDQPYEVFEDDSWTTRVMDFHASLNARIMEEQASLVEAFQGSKAEPVVAHYVQSMVLQRRDGEARMTPFATIGVAEFHEDGQDISDDASRFLSKLTYALQWGQCSRFTWDPASGARPLQDI